MRHIGTQPIQTPRLLLRRYTLDDTDAMYDNWASDDRVTRTLTWPTHPDKGVTRVVLETWVGSYDQESYYHWGITVDGKLVGDIAVVNASWEDQNAEIGYCLGYDLWGQGYMTEALTGVLGFLFDRVGLHRVYLRHDSINGASGRVMAKSGLVHEATLREHRLHPDGTASDLEYYGILRREWEARRA